jgi:hypothetical protein
MGMTRIVYTTQCRRYVSVSQDSEFNVFVILGHTFVLSGDGWLVQPLRQTCVNILRYLRELISPCVNS